MSRSLLTLFLTLTLIITLSLNAEEHHDDLPVPSDTKTQAERPAFIPLSDVPEKAVETLNILKEIATALNDDPKVQEIHTALPAYTEAIQAYLDSDIYQHLDTLNTRKLQKIRYDWRIYQEKLKEWETRFNEQITLFDKRGKELESYSELWSATHINANKENAPEVIQNHIANVIIKIEELRNRVKRQYDQLLTDTNTITTMISKIDEKTTLLTKAEEELSNRLLHQDQPPLFEALQEEEFNTLEYFKSIYQNISDKSNEFKIYYQSNPGKKAIVTLFALLIGSFIAYFFWLYRQKRLFVKSISRQRKEFFFIKRPISTFVLLIALVNVVVFNDQPQAVRDLILFIIFIPIMRIIQTIAAKEVIPYLYSYFALFFFDMVEKNALTEGLDERFFLITIDIAMIALITFYIKNHTHLAAKFSLLKSVIYKMLPLMVLLLIGAILANIYGTVLLSSKITHGLFIAIHSSIIFYTLTIILSGYLIILLRRRIDLVSNLLDRYSEKIERNVTLFIKFIMVIWWFKILIRTLGFENKFNTFVDETLGLSWVVGTTTISVNSIVSFVVILLGTWVIARTVQIVLEVELFSRVKFSRGVPTAISTVSNYTIVISGILIALSSLGITTQQLALVFGALGVGIGFGLRNIIANFISGIIMVFERPIQIGDTIEVDNTMGKVIHIGTRASAIKTFDGSEVIVPNESFISSKIINWTLSDERRRKELDIKVAFDSEIETVLEIMKAVALAHPSVLKDPEPLATFQGFGDYYLEFRLYYWLADNLIVAQSDVAIGIYKRLKEADIATPMPIQKLVMPQDRA